MSAELIKRLRSGSINAEPIVLAGVEHDARCLEAADEIEKLRKQMREAVAIAERMQDVIKEMKE